MAETISNNPRGIPGLKPVVILAFAVILMLKTQKAATTEVESEETGNVTPSESPVCPEYCNLAADRATKGKAPFRMWYFDVSEGSCRRFRWGGRGGNKNRFRKKVDCEETCSKCTPADTLDEYGNAKGLGPSEQSQNDTICSLSINEGKCTEESGSGTRQPVLVWHFNREKAKCTPFIFYGCGGNQNRFGSKDECEETCH